MIYASRATMERETTFVRTGAAKESAKRLQAATKTGEETIVAADFYTKRIERASGASMRLESESE